jgi:hypothetical protein
LASGFDAMVDDVSPHCTRRSGFNDSSAASTAASSGTAASPADKKEEKKDSAAETKAAVLKRFKKVPDAKGLPDDFTDCMANVIMKYAKPDEIEKYASGEIKLDKLDNSLNADEANDAGFKCTDLVTAPPSVS